MTEARGTSLEERMFAIERRHEEFARRLDKLEIGLHENNELTHEIKSDTSQIVNLFKASEFTATVIKWLASVGGAVIVAWAAYRGLTK